MTKTKINIIFGVAITLLLASAGNVYAATLYLVPEDNSLSIGEDLAVDVKIDTDEEFINAAQATISYPGDVLELVSVSTSGTFSFWVQEPTLGSSGVANFIGGSASGVTGKGLQVIRLNFKTRGAGEAALSLSEAVVTASDGLGTNVLSVMTGTNIVVGTNIVEAPPAPEVAEEDMAKPQPKPPAPIIQPKVIQRVATVATDLPKAPIVSVALYPDQTEWYSAVADVIALWQVPTDVVQVSTQLSKTQNTEPGKKQNELFNGQNFGPIEEEGIWYIRVQFRNNIGWGELTYYKISLDTTPPLPVDIEIDNASSDDPTPQIRFETSDSLSGLSHARIFVNADQPVEFPITTITALTTALPVQAPGQHQATVQVFDRAGNRSESTIDFETLPIPTPVVTFISKRVAEGEVIFISGTAVPSGTVTMQITLNGSKVVFNSQTPSDNVGNWSFTVEEPLKKGAYVVTASVIDDRGAQSYTSDGADFKIKPKVVFSIGLIEMGWLEILVVTVLVFLGVGGAAGWTYMVARKKRDAYREIAGRDVEKMTALLGENVKELENFIATQRKLIEPRSLEEIKFHVNKIKITAQKMKKYLTRELDKLK